MIFFTKSLIKYTTNIQTVIIRGSRGGTPVQSDTEVELARTGTGDKSSQSWRWGELPEPPVRVEPDSPDSPASPASPAEPASPTEPLSSDEERQGRRGVLSGMFRFMSKEATEVAAEGVYLDDLDRGQVDPDLYFPKHHAERYRSGKSYFLLRHFNYNFFFGKLIYLINRLEFTCNFVYYTRFQK